MQPVTIIIADDDPGHALLIEFHLRRQGFNQDLLRFHDGQQVLDFLLGGKCELDPSSSETGRYILLLDIRMPKVDGVEVLRQLRESPACRHLPIIVLTTTDDPKEIRQCHRLGCTNYIVKPLAGEGFTAAMQQIWMFVRGFHSAQTAVSASCAEEHTAAA